jgi:polygalacturonase
MKKICLILPLVFLLILLSSQAALTTPKVVLNGDTLSFDVPPIIENGRTLVPLRAIFEAMGANVSWEDTTRTVTATKENTEIKLTIGGQAYKNGQLVTLDVPAKIINDRTMVPLRFVSESFGCQVVWDNTTQTIAITSYNVIDYGAKGSDTFDDTAAIQKAINYINSIGGGTVYIPDGTYYINTSTPIKPKSNVKLKLATNAVLKAIPTAEGSYDIVMFSGVSNAEIDGGNIVGDRYEHLGTDGEHGYGIRITSSSNIRVANIKISECWGDGIIIGGLLATQPYSKNVIIENFVSDNNRRQGISVISAKGLIIRNGVLSNTKGTAPQAGIDFEPDLVTHRIQDVLVEDVKIINNKGWGIDWWFKKLMGSRNNVTIKINNCIVTGNGSGQIRYGSGFTSVNSYYKYLDITVNGVQIGSKGV